jgi:hypothetical protein
MPLKQIKNTMTRSLQKLQKEMSTLPKETYDFWVAQTPKKTGQARNKTNLKGDTIVANYAYAKKLDEGYSQQAPKGMSKPTEKFLQELLKRKIRK